MLAPLKRPPFRLLWIGMSLSYAGDRLQELAQGWLVATLSSSALAVGGIGVMGSIGMLLMPLGGVLADQFDRRRMIILGQAAGALTTAVMAILAFSERIAVWHVYLWALISGLTWMVMRPAYKVVVTQAVPPEEVRPAVSLNSITETSAIVSVNVGGSALLGWLGLPLAFLLNALSYLAALFCLSRLKQLSRPMTGTRAQLKRIFSDLGDGLRYLRRDKPLLSPLLLTFTGISLTGTLISLLPAIVKAQGGTIFQLGLLGGAGSLGALLGAVLAGTRSEGNPMRTYPLLGLGAAFSILLFLIKPLSLFGAFALTLQGFIAFSQAVWNTSRVPRLADPAYQARLQSLTTMTFTLGSPFAALWGGFAVDRFGLYALALGALILAGICVFILLRKPQYRIN